MSSLRPSFASLALSVVLLAACAHSTASTNKDDEGVGGAAGDAGAAGTAGTGGSGGGAAGTAGVGGGGSGGVAGGGAAGAAGAAGAGAGGGGAGGAGGAGAGGAGGNPFGGSGGSTGGSGGSSPGKSVVINEVATSGPSGNADDEFVELFNPTSSDVSLSGWVLKYASKTGSGIKTWEGAAGDKIVSGGYLVLGGSKFSGSSKGDLTLAMAKDGGGLALYDGTTLKDKMAWNTGNDFVDGAPAPVSGDTDTASRIPDGQDTNDNGADFQLGKRTPGAANALLAAQRTASTDLPRGRGGPTWMRMAHRLTSETIDDEAALRALIGEPAPIVCAKVSTRLNPLTRQFVERSPFVCVATSDLDGNCDVSPRGDPAGFVRILDDVTLLVPERPGNRIADTLRNILSNGHVGLLFVIPGVGDAFRVNGRATLTTDQALLAPCAVEGKVPRLGILVDVEQAYTQCSKALLRSALWDPARFVDRSVLPTNGQIHAELAGEGFDAAAYDEARAARYARREGFY